MFFYLLDIFYKDISMNDYFCNIDDEPKAFEIVKLYHYKTEGIKQEKEKEILNRIDNELQIKEMQAHLIRNNVVEERQTSEKIDWALQHGHSFRIYLNTLKVLCLVLEAHCVDFDDLTFEEFCEIKNRVNQHQAFLNIIHK